MAVRQTDKSQEIHKLNSVCSGCCENKHGGVSKVPRVSAKCSFPGFCQPVSKHQPYLNTRFAGFRNGLALGDKGKKQEPSTHCWCQAAGKLFTHPNQLCPHGWAGGSAVRLCDAGPPPHDHHKHSWVGVYAIF